MRIVLFILIFAVAVPPCLADTTDGCIVRLGRSVGRLRQSQRIRLGSITNRYDAEKLKKILGDPRVTIPFLRNVGTDITTIDTIVSEHRMEVIQGTHKGARYAVFLGKEVVGTVNMAYDPAVKGASIGYAIAPRYQGRGLATEAAGLLIRAILDNFEIVDIRALIDGKNLASLAVIMKLGFSSEAEAAEKYPGYFYYYLYPQNFPLK